MAYIDGFIAAVPKANRELYFKHVKIYAAIMRDHGALKVTECWEEGAPDGAAAFAQAVGRKQDEAIVFSWVTWPSREAREEGFKKFMADPRMKEMGTTPPFDGKRMMRGCFEVVHES